MAVAHINSDMKHNSSSPLFGAEVQLTPILLKVEREVSQILHNQGNLIERSTVMIDRTLEYLQRCLPKVLEAMSEINSTSGRAQDKIGKNTYRRAMQEDGDFIFSDVDEGVVTSTPGARSHEPNLTIRERDVHIALGLEQRDQQHGTGRSTEDRLREVEDQISGLLAHFDGMSQAQTKSSDMSKVMNKRDITLSSGLVKHLQNSPQNSIQNAHNKPERDATLQQSVERLADELACLRVSSESLRESSSTNVSTDLRPVEDLKLAAWLRDHASAHTLANEQPQALATEQLARSAAGSSHNARSVGGFLAAFTSGDAPNACTAEDLRIGLQSFEEKVLTQLASWPRWFDSVLKGLKDDLLEAMKSVLNSQLVAIRASPEPEGTLTAMKNSSNSRPGAVDASPDPRKILKALANSRPPPLEVPEKDVKTRPSISSLPLAAVSGGYGGYDTPLSTPGSEGRGAHPWSEGSGRIRLANVKQTDPR